jgi:subtilase family serine protease
VAIPDLYNVSIQNFYSANTVFNDAGDVPAGGSILGVHVALAAGATYSGSFFASGTVPAGTPYLTAKIDWGNLIAEANESNNTFAALIP